MAPKRYLVDSGLFAGILGITENDVVTDGDLLGRVIETFVVAQIRAESALMSPTPGCTICARPKVAKREISSSKSARGD